MRATTLLLFLLILALLVPAPSEAQHWSRGFRAPDSYKGMPYGQYCPGHRWGPYGEPRTLKTAEEAKRAIETYFADSGRPEQVVKIEERKWYFEADIAGPDGKLTDKVIIDKRTGRIRSIY